MKIRFIGDVHGHFNRYIDLCKKSDLPTVQIGDMGVGFDLWNDADIEKFFNETDSHKFIRGNHDDPSKCKDLKGYIQDGAVEGNIMYMGGAWSIDYAYRTLGVNIWADEELSIEDLNLMIDVYERVKPEIMVTHDCPLSFSRDHIIAGRGPSFTTRTPSALDTMLEIHKPKVWVFGHWHKNLKKEVDETVFVCLDELNYIDIDIQTMEMSEIERAV